jgi:hypothetical protein
VVTAAARTSVAAVTRRRVHPIDVINQTSMSGQREMWPSGVSLGMPHRDRQ